MVEYGWQELDPVADYPIISQAEAFQRLRECRGIIAFGSGSMDVTSVDLVYLGVPGPTPYQYLIPAYDFTHHFEDGTRQVAIIPAITDEYLTVNPPPPCPCETPTP